jgi:hypothetical protein
MRNINDEAPITAITPDQVVSGVHFAKWMNESAGTDLNQRLTEVVELAIRSSFRSPADLKAVKDAETIQTQIDWARYKYFVRGPLPNGRWLISLIPAEGKDAESGMILMLMELIQAGAATRFRRCRQCKQWFFALRAKQFFCSGRCGETYRRATPEAKAKWREYIKLFRKRKAKKEKEKARLAQLNAKNAKARRKSR